MPSCQPAVWIAGWLSIVPSCRYGSMKAGQQASMPASGADSELACHRERVLASKPAIVLSVEA